MTNFDFHPTSKQVFCRYGFKEQTLFIIPTFYKYPFEFTVGFRTNYFMFFYTFLQLWQYMLIILTWEFFH
jgi:hypothetical protein